MPIKGLILLFIVAVVIAVVYHKEIYQWIKTNLK